MNAPHMSGRATETEQPNHIDPADLLDANGKVDSSKVRSRANAINGANGHIDADTCTAIREYLAETRHAGETSDRFGHGETAIRRHAKGECHHSDREIDAPPLTFTRGVGWEVDR